MTEAQKSWFREQFDKLRERMIDELQRDAPFIESGERLKCSVEAWFSSDPNRPWSQKPDSDDGYIDLRITTSRTESV
jgi:hypothetical protein